MTTATKAPSATERTERSQAIHTNLGDAAALINAAHARILSDVIEAKNWNIHRDVDGFSALRAWLIATFDFHASVASDIAVIAKYATKFRVLAGAATAGAARIDPVAFAVRRLDRTAAMRLVARTPYREPVASPFDSEVTCATPEAMIAQYCAHAPFADLQRHLDELAASIAEHEELLDGLSEQTLQRLEVWQNPSGMWSITGELSSDTGAMLNKALKTAVPPPRQADVDADGVLPPAAGRNAEALHQMLAAYANNPAAATRHGETCHLNLSVDIETLQGLDTGRTATLEGDPISLAKARLLACEAVVIPSVFNYSTGEAIELGRAMRLPNTALRRKLELEQAGGCAWTGCDAPVVWTEAHHIQHWADGGETVAQNLILLCRFHHGRIHTPGWTVTKTGPGQALIVHHEGHDDSDADLRCGCADYRTDEDLDLDFEADIANVFPTGLYPEEWGPNLKDDLDATAEQIDQQDTETQIREARARLRAKFTTPKTNPTEPHTSTSAGAHAGSGAGTEPGGERGGEPSPPRQHERASETEASPQPAGPVMRETVREAVGRTLATSATGPDDPIPFLPRPSRDAVAGKDAHTAPSSNPRRIRALPRAQS